MAVEAKKTGRPPKYETPEEMQEAIDLYFLVCKSNQREDATLLEGLPPEQLEMIKEIEDVVPTVSGLSYTLGMSTEALRNYQDKDMFLATVKRAKQRIEMNLEQRLAGQAVTGVIFNLKNNFGWKDKQEVDNTSSDGSMTPKGVELVIVDPKNEAEKTDT